MKAVWGLIFALILNTSALASERTLARFAYEEAEAAFQRNDIATTLSKLDEAERLLGNANPPILYLRVQARHASLQSGPFLHASYTALMADADRFMKNYGGRQDLLDMTRDVYRISQEMEARQRREQEAFNAERTAAEAGDPAAIAALVQRYTTGVGVAQDPDQARRWQDRLAAAELQRDREAAANGDVAALNRMASRYETGNGVERDPAQAERLRAQAAERVAQREAEAARQKAAQEQQARQAEAEKKLAEISYFEHTKQAPEDWVEMAGGDPSVAVTSVPTGLMGTALGLLSDVVVAPTKITQVQSLKREASVRAATWANPDSAIARAAARQDAQQVARIAQP